MSSPPHPPTPPPEVEGRLQEVDHSATCVSAIVLEARELGGLADWLALGIFLLYWVVRTYL